MQVKVAESEIRWVAEATDILAGVLQAKPEARIGWPTGTTPLPFYAELRRRAAIGSLAAQVSRAVMLDEYLDPPEAAFSSWSWLWREVWTPLRLGREQVLRMPHRSPGIDAACGEFERALAEGGGCDLLILGLGANGHVGFNEPGTAMDTRTRVVKLTAETADANAAYWRGRFTPEFAVTMGMATILEARQILLLVRGGAKADVLRRMLHDPVSSELPATFLREHEGLTILADPEAAAEL